jgi:HSP20 family molecular chaperone IbpA
MPNNPYDEIFRSIAKILEGVLGENGEPPRIIECTIIASGDSPGRAQGQDDAGPGFSYEVTESEECVYITARVPPACEGRASVAFGPQAVTVTMGERQATIDLDDEIDPEESSVSVNHGVLDVVCVKIRGEGRSSP